MSELEALRARVKNPDSHAADIAAAVARIVSILDEAATAPDDIRAERKCECVALLGKAAPRSDAAVARLVQALSDEDSYEDDHGSSDPRDLAVIAVQVQARDALRGVEKRAVAMLIPMLERGGVACRALAADLLGRAEDPIAVPALQRHRAHAEIEIRVATERALTQIRRAEPAHVGRVRQMLEDPATRKEGFEEAEAVGPGTRAALVDVLVALIEEPSARNGALWVLGKTGRAAERAIPRILELLAEPNEYVFRALEGIGSDDPVVARALMTIARTAPARSGSATHARRALAKQGPSALAPFTEQLLRELAGAEGALAGEWAFVLVGLGAAAPPEVERALTRRAMDLKDDRAAFARVADARDRLRLAQRKPRRA